MPTGTRCGASPGTATGTLTRSAAPPPRCSCSQIVLTRAAADIGRGLAAARDARPIRAGERIHVLGAAGAGASAAVLLAHRCGALVTGCDPGGPSPYTAALLQSGMALTWQHSVDHIT